MTNARIQYYLTVANEITPSSRNPYDLCKELEIEIINNCALHKDAYFVCQEGLKLIFVNSCIKNRHRRKFVTAHEIGHYFLHQDKLYCCNNISEINLSSSIKVNSSSQEYEANTFASEYVLPTSLLQEKLPNREIHFSDIFTIANEFDVSVTLTAMKSIQYSKTESESLLCYENNRLKWFAFSNNDDMDKSAVPSRCPFDSLLCSQSTDITGYWDDLYRGSVHQEVFSPYAGCSPSTYQSGKLTNCYAHMEKRGSRYLRYALYTATKYVCYWNPVFTEYLTKKQAEGKHYNVALSHATKKLVRLIYALQKSGKAYLAVT